MTAHLPRLPEHTQRLLDDIVAAALQHQPADPTRPGGPKQPALRTLLTRAERVLVATRTATTRADGYATTTPGNGLPGGGKGARRTSSTETAAFAEHPGWSGEKRDRPPSDWPGDRIAAEIVTELRHLQSALHRIGWAVDRYDRLHSTIAAAAVDAPQCYVAAMRKLPFDEAWTPTVSTRFDGVLPEPWDEERIVCRWVYDFTRRLRRLPSRDEMRQYLERGSVRLLTGSGQT